MISIHIPKDSEPPNIKSEIMSARNIKDKKVRDNTIEGLNKISNYLSNLDTQKNGISIFWNDEELVVEPYDRIEKHYYCGKELLQFKEGKTLMYSILVVDLSECYFADVFSDGEIRKLFSGESTVPKKQGQGGQSQPRFQATRENEIIAWFKKINRMLMEYDRQIILSINWMHYNTFMSYMHTYNVAKIIRHIRGEYSGLNGIYDTINRLERYK